MRRLLALVLVAAGFVSAPAVDAATPTSSVYVAGNAAEVGSTGDLVLNGPVVDIVASATGRGYWQLGSDGGVFSFGDAPFYGSTGDIPLNRPVVSMSPTPRGGGYWFVATDGGVFAFGDAPFHGSTGDIRLNQPVVGMAPTRTGGGYLLVAADGGVFAFGDAAFMGSLGDQRLPDPIVALSPLPGGDGYWLVDRIGRVYPFGNARHLGHIETDDRATDIKGTPTGRGYWVLRQSGAVHEFGDALRLQPPVRLGPGQRAVGLANTPDGRGLWVSTTGKFQPPSTARARGPHAFLVTDSSGRPGRWNPCAPITWLFNAESSPPGGEEVVADAFGWLGSITGLSFRYGGRTTTEPQPVLRDTIIVGWRRGIGAAGIGGPVTVSTSRGFRHVSGAVQLNADLPLPAGWGSGAWGPVVLHELAHVLGLDHVDDPEQLMYPVGSHQYDFASGDLAGLHRLGSAPGCL